MIKHWRPIAVIALNTFRETVRDKLLYSLVGFAGLVIAASLLAGSVSLGQDVRVIQDFSLTAMFVFLLIIILFIGTQLLRREVERKTIYLVLSKPISRESFFLGKYFGLCLTVTVSALIMAVIFFSLLYYKTHVFPAAALWAVGFLILEAWLLTAVGLLFGSFASPISSAIYTFTLALIGHSSTTIWQVAEKAPSVLSYLLKFIYFIFPNLEKFNLRNEVIFNFQPDLTQILLVIGYFVGYTTVLLILGILAFRRHEV